jgi:facilitated trehalose transporter
VSECASPEIRGLLASFPAMFMALGISSTYLMGAMVPWDILSYLCAIMPTLGGVLMFLMPESPVALRNQGKTIKALTSGLWLNHCATETTLKSGTTSNETIARTLSNVKSTKGIPVVR